MNNGDEDGRILREVRGGRREPEDWLEELLRRVRDYFGGGGGGTGRGPGRSSFPHTVVYGILILLALIGILTSVYTVDVSEEGVVTRFQRYHTTSPSGLHFKLPFFIDSVTKVPSKVLLQEEFGFRSHDQQGVKTEYSKDSYGEESLMLTGDLNVADVEWIVQFRISDPWKFLFHARDVKKNIRDVSMSIMRRVVGDRLVGEVLTTGRVEIADDAKKLTQEVLDKYDMGIAVAAIVLQDVTPPETVKAAFNDVNAAKQEQEKAINVAEREYNNVIPEAKGKAEQVIAEAGAYAVMLVNGAKGDAANFNSRLVEYRRAPEITRRRLYLEAMEEIFSGLDKLIIVDSKVRGIIPLYPPQAGIPMPVPQPAPAVKGESPSE
ncbi:MAG: FtsH protease activity modulator HflK [Deltaproteobacteria bacterium]|nr:FtsH protease activity modulator HflK [Deltaproteobacteria bacterium]